MKKILIGCLAVLFLLFILNDEIKPFERRTGIQGVPKGDLVAESLSPNKNYQLRLYELGGEATVDFGRIGEIEYLDKDVNKVIYFNYHENKNHIKWLSGTIVNINGKTLDVRQDVYNYKRNLYNYFKKY